MKPGVIGSTDLDSWSEIPPDHLMRGDVWIFAIPGSPPCRTVIRAHAVRELHGSIPEPSGPRYQVVALANGCEPADQADPRAWVVDSAVVDGCSFAGVKAEHGQVVPSSTPHDWFEDERNAKAPIRALPDLYRSLLPECKPSCLTLWQIWRVDSTPAVAAVSINRIATRYLMSSDPCFHAQRVEGLFTLGGGRPIKLLDETRLSGALVYEGRPEVLLIDHGGSYRAVRPSGSDSREVIFEIFPGNQDGSCSLW